MATSNILRVVCSGTVHLEKKNAFYQVISPYITKLSSCGAVPRCNPTALNSRNLRRLIESFEEDVAPDIDDELRRKCRVQLAVLEKLYTALEILELQGVKAAAKFLSELIDGCHNDTNEALRLEMISNEALMQLHLDLNSENGAAQSNGPTAGFDDSVMRGKLNKLADILEKHLRHSVTLSRILIAVPSAALCEEVNKILLAMPRIASSFVYDVRKYSKTIHKNFLDSQYNCIVVVSDPSTNEAPTLEISGIDLAICLDVPKTALRRVPKWKGSVYMLLTSVENRSFLEKSLFVDEPSSKASKTGCYSMNLKSSLAKQAARGRKGYLTKEEQALFDRNFRCDINVLLPERGAHIQQTASQRRNVRHLSFSTWGPWQKEPQQTFRVGHAEDTEAMVQALALCDRLDGNAGIDDFEKKLYAHFCPEDVFSSWKGKMLRNVNDEKGYGMDTAGEELDYSGHEFLAITNEMSPYVLDSVEKIKNYLSDIGITTSAPQCEVYVSVAETQIIAAATSTYTISLTGTDGRPQSPENPLISLRKLSSCRAASQKMSPEHIGNDVPLLRISQKTSDSEDEDLFNDITTPAASKVFPSTSTPFLAKATTQGLTDNLTPFHPNERITPIKPLQRSQAANIESTSSQSRLGVTALVNLVQKRKKQKNLQYFFKTQTQDKHQQENDPKTIVILSDDDSNHSNGAYVGALYRGNRTEPNDATLVPQNDTSREQTSATNRVNAQYSQDGYKDSHDGSLFAFDGETLRGKTKHLSKTISGTFPERENASNRIVQLSSSRDNIPEDIATCVYNSDNQVHSHVRIQEVEQIERPIIDDHEEKNACTFYEINESELIKNAKTETEQPISCTPAIETTTMRIIHEISSCKDGRGRMALYKAANHALQYAQNCTTSDPPIAGMSSASISGAVQNSSVLTLEDDDDLFQQIDEEEIFQARQKMNTQASVSKDDGSTKIGGNGSWNSSAQKAIPTKKIRSVFDALKEHEQTVKPRETTKSLYDILNKFAAKDKHPELKVKREVTHFENIFTDEFEKELRTIDEHEKQRTPNSKSDEGAENDSDERRNDVIESSSAEKEIGKDDVLRKLLKKINERRKNKDKLASPRPRATRDYLEVVAEPSIKKGFKKQKIAAVKDANDETSPVKCLPMAVTAQKEVIPFKKEVIDALSDGEPSKLVEEKLKFKLDLNSKGPVASETQVKLKNTATATWSNVAKSQKIQKVAYEDDDDKALSSFSEDAVPLTSRRYFRKQKACKQNWSSTSSSADEEVGNLLEGLGDDGQNSDKVALVQPTTARAWLEDRTMGNLFEDLEERKPKKRPRHEFLEEEAELDSVDEDFVSTDEDETNHDAYEINSFVDDTSPIAQTQGMYLQVNVQLSPHGKHPLIRSGRNLVPIEECYSQPSSVDDTSYDSQDSFVVKGDVEEPTLPLEITVMEQTSILSSVRANSSITQKISRDKKVSNKKRRRVFIQSSSDESDITKSVRSEHSFVKNALTTNTKHQHSDGDYVKDLNEASYNKDKAALSDPVVPTGLPNLMQSAITSDALPTRVVLANMELMETFPDILVGLNRTFKGYHIEPVDMKNLEDHQADIYVEDLCVKILPFNTLASDYLQQKVKHQLSRFKQMATYPVLIIYTGPASPETSALALPILVHLLRTNIQSFYANNQVDILMLLKCLVGPSPVDNSNLLRFLESAELCRLLKVPDLNISTATKLLANKKSAQNVLQCSAGDITRICGVSDQSAEQIYTAFQTLRSSISVDY
ncbi:uncharacterized protein LOC111251995 isoform X3 [Varroa destructor]|uniref:Fanconi anemia group M protein MHF binding domain-containing protein n=1 Tax=Varroa destructor TaxID=109461 RepID=A0A7M7KKD8_VARDE|nr:uncharacterized protein LOC111251995 isoform X3 [Varroa destructor]